MVFASTSEIPGVSLTSSVAACARLGAVRRDDRVPVGRRLEVERVLEAHHVPRRRPRPSAARGSRRPAARWSGRRGSPPRPGRAPSAGAPPRTVGAPDDLERRRARARVAPSASGAAGTPATTISSNGGGSGSTSARLSQRGGSETRASTGWPGSTRHRSGPGEREEEQGADDGERRDRLRGSFGAGARRPSSRRARAARAAGDRAARHGAKSSGGSAPERRGAARRAARGGLARRPGAAHAPSFATRIRGSTKP